MLSQIVEFRNGESGLHVQHIRVLTEKILDHLLEKTSDYKISAEEQDNIPLASALHDIGKITIDENILNKPGRLTKEEFEVIKTHCWKTLRMNPCCKPPTTSPAGTMSAGMAGATRTASRAMTSPSARKSSPWPMCTTP